MDAVASVSHAALAGIDRNLRALGKTAQQIAAPADRAEPGGLAEPLVRAQEQRQAIQASVRVLECADRMLGALLDETA
jgi:hypothetical protein